MTGATERSRPTGLGDFEETLKDFWATRPRRPRHGRKVAGVAAGIADRYGVDPVLVRVAFATATIFGGVGISLYVLGWLFFPAENDEVSPVEALFGRGRSSTSRAFTIVLAVALLPLTGWAFGGGWFDGGSLLAAALLVTGLYLLHRGRGQEYRPPVTGPTGPTAAFSTTSTPSASSGTAESPSGWDPLGADPLAWDLPDPRPEPPVTPPPAPARRRNAKVGVITFAVALLVAGAGVALGAMGVAWFSPPHVIGLTLSVLGLGMVTGAFLRGGRGLIALAVPLSIVGLVTTAVPFPSYHGGFGDIDAVPGTAAEVQPVYQHTAGDINLVLTNLARTDVVSTEVLNGAGTTTVVVPADADVRYACDVRVGDVDCLGHIAKGTNPSTVSGTDLGTDGPGGAQITLKVSAGAGRVEVNRA
ncbi:PspC domain-containing protein [Amycolatopsis pigmentata]|uniref:PspC domain-containing protein n=1 Tax=Amycolatopsis pigmentata TaxID=450801 RepID=A0ABW5G3L5_9PSEU